MAALFSKPPTFIVCHVKKDQIVLGGNGIFQSNSLAENGAGTAGADTKVRPPKAGWMH